MPPDEVVQGQGRLEIQTESISARILGVIFGACLIGYGAIGAGMCPDRPEWQLAAHTGAPWISIVAGGCTLAGLVLYPSTSGFRPVQRLALGVNSIALAYFLWLYRAEQSSGSADPFGGAYPQALLSTVCGLSIYFARPFRNQQPPVHGTFSDRSRA